MTGIKMLLWLANACSIFKKTRDMKVLLWLTKSCPLLKEKEKKNARIACRFLTGEELRKGRK